jgi:hypothetical protein
MLVMRSSPWLGRKVNRELDYEPCKDKNSHRKGFSRRTSVRRKQLAGHGLQAHQDSNTIYLQVINSVQAMKTNY